MTNTNRLFSAEANTKSIFGPALALHITNLSLLSSLLLLLQNVVNSCINRKSFCSSDDCPESFISGNGRSLASLSNPCVNTDSVLSNGRQKDTKSRVKTSFRSASGQYTDVTDGKSMDRSNQSNTKVDFAVEEGNQSSVVTNKQTHENAPKYALPAASKRWYYKDPNNAIQGG